MISKKSFKKSLKTRQELICALPDMLNVHMALTTSKTLHTPGPWIAEPKQADGQAIGIWSLTTIEVIAVTPPNSTANASLIAASPDMLDELHRTESYAIQLMERAAKLDRMLAEAKGTTLDTELGEIIRLRQQLGRNRAAIAKATS